MRQIVLFVSCVVFFSVLHVKAAEPNYVRSRVINVDGDGNDVVSTGYSDGLGRSIQSKLQLSSGRARVVSTFYDDAGRPYLSTKPFIDKTENQNTLYTPGDFAEINGTLNDSTNYASFITSGDNAYAYSETEYHDDPLGRVKRAGSPGEDYHLGSGHFTASWSFGVTNTGTETFTVDVSGTDVTVTIVDGFITVPDPLTVGVLDALYNHLLVSPLNDADHFLTVARDPDDKYTMELKDLFGRTVATRAGTIANPIIAGYSHDILGNLLSETAPKDVSTTLISDSRYEYNTLGQLVRKESPDGAIERMDYDDAGNMIYNSTYVMKNGSEAFKEGFVYEYDDLSRLIQIFKSFDRGHVLLAKYYYDDADAFFADAKLHGISLDPSVSLANTQGKLVAEIAFNRPPGKLFYKAVSSNVVDMYGYDDDSRIVKKFKVIPGLPMQVITYEYDLHGKIKTEEFICGTTVSKKYYKYDADGNLKAIAHGDGDDETTSFANDIVTYSYEKLGKLDFKNFTRISGDNKLSYTYNVRDWMKTSNFNGMNSFSQSLDYTTDQSNAPINTEKSYNGNIRSSILTYQNNSDEELYTQSYSYDNLNRLVSFQTEDRTDANAIVAEFTGDFEYDNAGRFTKKHEGESENTLYDYYHDQIYTRATSRLKKAKTSTDLYIYDYKGNLIIDKSKNLYISYDWRNMPIKFSFYRALPVGEDESALISPDVYGTIKINDISYTGSEDPCNYIDWKYAKGDLELLSTVQMLYDASGKRVLKIAK
ncbi:MAG: hypothetical protein JW915_15080 [Chitinispirillaceae bacterium]|nr:hypothetical protein [Chitinispirillaceae bacterium]